MSFTSQLYPGEAIFDDSTPEHATLPPAGTTRGLMLDRRTTPFGQMVGAPPFPQELLIPRGEWQARIQEMEERKSNISSISIAAGLPCKDQDGIPYCWIFGPTHCAEIVRVIQNQPMVELSAASAGALIKNFRAEGGWGEEGLAWLVEHGQVPTSTWPENKLDRRYATAENKQLALQYRVTEWMELRPRNTDELVSCLLRRIPVAGGYNWWSHEITNCDAVWLDGDVSIRIRNSWSMSWGDKGFSILRGSKMLADDAVAPHVATAS